MSKIFKKIFNGLLFIKNFLIILFELKSHSTKMYEFLDDILSKMGEGDLDVKKISDFKTTNFCYIT